MADKENQPISSVDALAAMAGGINLDQKKPTQKEELTPEAIAAITAAGGTPPESNMVIVDEGDPDGSSDSGPIALGAMPQVTLPTSSPIMRKTQDAKFQSNASKATMTQYKRLLVPLLLIVGGLLIIIGVASFALSGPATMSDNGLDQSISLGSEAKWFGMICVPMGLILMVGAWIIKMELNRLDKKV